MDFMAILNSQSATHHPFVLCSAKQCAAPTKNTLNHLMLVWSAVCDLWYSSCGLVAQYSTRQSCVVYLHLDHTPHAINHVWHSTSTLSNTYNGGIVPIGKYIIPSTPSCCLYLSSFYSPLFLRLLLNHTHYTYVLF